MADQSLTILDQAIAEYEPAHVFSLFSGGHDSWATTHLVSRHPSFTAAVHINTGIGIPETRQFVRDQCAAYEIPLLEYKAAECKPVPQVYEELVRRHGFPGPAQHARMYNQLKERCLRQLIREHKVGRRDHIMLVTGVRAQESTRRMGHVEEIQHDGVRVWVAPIAHWSAEDVSQYIYRQSLPRNPVKEKLCISGECLCGAFAKLEERREIAHFYPDVDRELSRLEAVAAASGKPCKWGHRPPGQLAKMSSKMVLCTSCQYGETEGH